MKRKTIHGVDMTLFFTYFFLCRCLRLLCICVDLFHLTHLSSPHFIPFHNIFLFFFDFFFDFDGFCSQFFIGLAVYIQHILSSCFGKRYFRCLNFGVNAAKHKSRAQSETGYIFNIGRASVVVRSWLRCLFLCSSVCV